MQSPFRLTKNRCSEKDMVDQTGKSLVSKYILCAWPQGLVIPFINMKIHLKSVDQTSGLWGSLNLYQVTVPSL